MRQQYGRRSQVLAGALAFFALAIVMQMTRIQNSPEAEIFREQAENYAYEWRTFYPNRGEIYDRNGRLLAGEKIVYEVGLDLTIMTDPHAVSFAMADTLNLDYDQLMEVIQNPPDGLSYIVLADYVDSQKANYLQELKKALNEQAPEGALGGLTGLQFKSHPQRSYPENSLARTCLALSTVKARAISVSKKNTITCSRAIL
jgi:cell division protein FtsI/penicillin-binding protein 2